MTAKTLYKNVFLRLSLFLIAGIIIQTLWNIYPWWIVVGCVSALITGISFVNKFSKSYYFRYLFGFGIALLCISAAGILTHYAWEKSEWKGSTGFAEYRVQVVSEGAKKPKTVMYKVKADGRDVVVYISPKAETADIPQIGEWMRIKARFEPSDEWYLKRQKIAARAFVAAGDWEILPEKSGFNLVFAAVKCRQALLKRLRAVCDNETKFSVAAAILLGYTGELESETRQTFAATGSSHILAVSGLHLSIVYGILYFLFSFLGNSRKAQISRQLIVLPSIWAFAFLCGLGPSVVRAAVVLTMLGFGNSLLYRSFSINNLSQAAFFMLLYNPLYLFNIGFQLSFAATYAILMINPCLTALYNPRNPLLRYFWQLSSVSVSAQLGTAPLCIYYFGQFPLLFLITNFFAIPLTGLLLIILPLTLILNGLFSGIALPVVVLNETLDVFLSGLQALERVPRGLIGGIEISIFETAILVIFIIFFFLLITRKRAIYVIFLLIFAGLQVFYYLCG